MIRRVAYLDGLRGFAALQVVLSHYVLASALAIGFIDPTIPHPAWENGFIHSPSFFFMDGNVAVSIFFLISGTVLTYSFEASGRSLSTQVARRLVRLGLPMAASILVGAVWYSCFPQAHIAAASLLDHNAWLFKGGPAHVKVGAVLKELCTALLFGHAHSSLIFPGRLGDHVGLLQISQSFNAPLWTLHLELYGSFIFLLLFASQQNVSAFWHRLFCAAIFCGLIAHPLGLFVIGYLAAKMLKTSFWEKLSASALAKILGCSAVILGASMSAHVAPVRFMQAYDRFIWFEKLPMKVDDFHFFGQYGAILIFFGILAVPGIQHVLGAGLGRLLGKYSFSLYLVHFPILLTLTSFLTVRFASMGVGAAYCVASLIGLSATAVLAYIFERWVDRPATELSRRLRVFGSRQAGPRRLGVAIAPVALSEVPATSEG